MAAAGFLVQQAAQFACPASSVFDVSQGGTSRYSMSASGGLTLNNAADQDFAIQIGGTSVLWYDYSSSAVIMEVPNMFDYIINYNTAQCFSIGADRSISMTCGSESGMITMGVAESMPTFSIDGSSKIMSLTVDPAEGSFAINDSTVDVLAIATSTGNVTLQSASTATLTLGVNTGGSITFADQTTGGLAITSAGPGDFTIADSVGGTALTITPSVAITFATGIDQAFTVNGAESSAMILSAAGAATITTAASTALTLTGHTGSSLVFSDAGAATLTVTAATALTLTGHTGSSLVFSSGGAPTLTATAGTALTLTGHTGSSLVFSAAGAASLTATASTALTLTGHTGSSMVLSATGAATITATTGTAATMAASGGSVVIDANGKVVITAASNQDVEFVVSGTGAVAIETAEFTVPQLKTYNITLPHDGTLTSIDASTFGVGSIFISVEATGDGTDDSNTAGCYVVSRGLTTGGAVTATRLSSVAGGLTEQIDIIWGDSSAFSMQFDTDVSAYTNANVVVNVSVLSTHST
jgi:hypothetical protein